MNVIINMGMCAERWVIRMVLESGRKNGGNTCKVNKNRKQLLNSRAEH